MYQPEGTYSNYKATGVRTQVAYVDTRDLGSASTTQLRGSSHNISLTMNDIVLVVSSRDERMANIF